MCIFYKPVCFTRKPSFAKEYRIHPAIFPEGALWADSIASRMNTIALGDHIKLIRIGENLVVNYNAW